MKQPTSRQLGLSNDVLMYMDKMTSHELFFERILPNSCGFLLIYLGV